MKYISRNYAFPIPSLNVTLGLKGQKPWLGPFPAILDTGADVMMVPQQLMRKLKARAVGDGRLRSQWDDHHYVSFYLIELQIEGVRLAGVEVAGDSITQEIILGRNVINKLPIFLDGPQQISEIVDDSTANRLRNRRKLA